MSRTVRITLVVALVIACSTGGASAGWPQRAGLAVPAVWRAADVLQAIGMNTHLSYPSTPYAQVDKVEAALNFLHITTLRDTLPIVPHGDARTEPYFQVMKDGFRFQFIEPANAQETAGFPTAMDAFEAGMHDVAATYPGAIAAIEGLNEPDIKDDRFEYRYKTLVGAPAVVQNQKDLYATLQADSLLSRIPRVAFDLNSPPYNQKTYEGVYSLDPNLGSTFQIANLGLDAGYWSPAYHIASDMGYPLDVGFNGTTSYAGPYAAALAPHYLTVKELSGVSASAGLPKQRLDYAVNAKIFPTALFDSLILGSIRTFVYELVDLHPDPIYKDGANFMGMYLNDWTPKPIAGVLHNLLGQLVDTAPNARSFETRPLSVTVPQFPIHAPGATSSGFTMEIQRSTGDYSILVWYEPLLWDVKAVKALPVPAPVPITVKLSQVCGATSIYDPLTGATTAGPSNVGVIPVSLPDHMLMINCRNPRSS